MRSKPATVSLIREQLSGWHEAAQGDELKLCTAIARMTGWGWKHFAAENAIALIDAAESMDPSPVRMEMTEAIRQLQKLLEADDRVTSFSDEAQTIVNAVLELSRNV